VLAKSRESAKLDTSKVTIDSWLKYHRMRNPCIPTNLCYAIDTQGVQISKDNRQSSNAKKLNTLEPNERFSKLGTDIYY